MQGMSLSSKLIGPLLVSIFPHISLQIQTFYASKSASEIIILRSAVLYTITIYTVFVLIEHSPVFLKNECSGHLGG